MTYKQSRESGICPTPQRALPAQDSSITGFSLCRTQKYNLPKIRWVDPVKVRKGNRKDLVVIMRKVVDHVALSPRSSSDNGPEISSWLSGTRKTSCKKRKAQRWTHRNRRSAGAYRSSLLSCSIRHFPRNPVHVTEAAGSRLHLPNYHYGLDWRSSPRVIYDNM